MIQLVCPSCRSKLKAKDELAGQTRPCPKCNTPVLIPGSAGPAAEAGEPTVSEQPAALLRAPPPERLVRHHRYLICDRTRVVGTWENNGHGWMILGDHKFVRALQNAERLPYQGDFKLVEICITSEGEMPHLSGLRVYQLADRWALVNLAHGDDAILNSVTGPAGLLRDQKSAVRQHIKEQFTDDFWEDAQIVREYLANDDFHTGEVGRVEP